MVRFPLPASESQINTRAYVKSHSKCDRKKKNQLAVESPKNRQVHKEIFLIYHQLTLFERYHIETGILLGLSITEISRRIGRHRSTVFREIKRNGHVRREGYSANASDQKYYERRTRQGRTKIDRAMQSEIDEKIKQKWSPEQIVGRFKLESKPIVSVETIYRYLYRDKIKGGVLWKNLRRSNGKRKKRFPRTPWPSRNQRLGIELRPQEIESRSRVGDFERDTMVGAGRSGYLLCMVDRKSKLTRLAKVKSLHAHVVHKATVMALKKLKPKSITNDNGLEFSGHLKTAKILKLPIYFTRPYASWERGTVENTNGLVRQYFNKATDFTEVSDEKIKMVEMALNRRPRKTLGYRTPLETNAQGANVALDC